MSGHLQTGKHPSAQHLAVVCSDACFHCLCVILHANSFHSLSFRVLTSTSPPIACYSKALRSRSRIQHEQEVVCLLFSCTLTLAPLTMGIPGSCNIQHCTRRFSVLYEECNAHNVTCYVSFLCRLHPGSRRGCAQPPVPAAYGASSIFAGYSSIVVISNNTQSCVPTCVVFLLLPPPAGSPQGPAGAAPTPSVQSFSRLSAAMEQLPTDCRLAVQLQLLAPMEVWLQAYKEAQVGRHITQMTLRSTVYCTCRLWFRAAVGSYLFRFDQQLTTGACGGSAALCYTTYAPAAMFLANKQTRQSDNGQEIQTCNASIWHVLLLKPACWGDAAPAPN